LSYYNLKNHILKTWSQVIHSLNKLYIKNRSTPCGKVLKNGCEQGKQIH